MPGIFLEDEDIPVNKTEKCFFPHGELIIFWETYNRHIFK